VLRGDARRLPLPDESVDLICTSPPYWSLRDYRDGAESLKGQIGAESSPGEYLESLWECTREWMRVLKPEGSIFVVLGDKYSDRADGGPASAQSWREDRAGCMPPGRSSTAMAPRKSRLMLPERYRIGCLDLGLLVRAVIIWSKPSAMPESVTDRVRTAHEDIVHLTKRPRYYAAVDEIREPHTRIDPPRKLGTRNRTQRHESATDNTGWKNHLVAHHPLGALPGSVWEIASQPLMVPDHVSHAQCCDGVKRGDCDQGLDHYAAYPMEIPRRIIRGWCPPAICTNCGEGLRPEVERTVIDPRPTRRIPGTGRDPYSRHGQPDAGSTLRGVHTSRIAGYKCACPEAPAYCRPSVVVDPFGGGRNDIACRRNVGPRWHLG
jgi:DNA modification methylase